MITKALWNIPSRSSCNELLKRYHDIVEFLVMPEFMIQYLISSLFDTFGSSLAEPRSKEKFIPFVETLLKNEETPLPPSPDDGIAWLNTFSGPNIRLEVMGLLFCFIGRSYQSLADEDPLFQKEENHGRNRRQTSWRMNECADVMGKMCDCTDAVNEIVVAFRVAIFVLESAVVGDESYGNLNRHENIVTSAYAFGLHRLPHLPPHLLTTAAEYKRRVIASVYQMDKCCSALNGTPPGIPRLYCRLHTLSDLSETELFLPRAQMQQAIAECDEQGWNRKGEMYCGTWNRSMMPIYMVKEEILERALAVDVQVSRERIDSLLARTASLSQNRPQQFSFNPTSTGVVLFVQLIVSLETLQNKFLLHRLALANHLEGNYNQGLLDTAMEMLEKVIMMWEKRDKLVGLEFSFDWVVTSFGVPAAGVVCVELLKLMSDWNGSRKRSKKEKTGTEGDERRAKEKEKTRFSRSMAVQKLTLFAAFLDWVRDTDGNYALLKRVRGVVGRVLKWVLDGGEMSREVDKEKGKDIPRQEDNSRVVNSQGTINPARVQMEERTTRGATENSGLTDQGTRDWNMEAANFTPQLMQPSTTINGDFTSNVQGGLDFNMNTVGLDLNFDLEGIGMEEMWGQVDWLNAGDWMGGSGGVGVGA
ncbi:fc803662-8e35-45f6-ad1b-14d4d9103ede [Sclerotinia trifoliorum]|uniref:Fc803662-8e35-45f6-ad1b-14d4d9103ede n=1 Tax=Sclerotinia trifoliorum TaxID=28548 RepID=A0A8H2VP81_9HELO|nr:fc803662-8e35-45f6-ad1b-14d4d9103ede [Sclerotinia trifoliorum]